MAINTRKVFIGGFAAGIVLNLIDYLSNVVIFGERMRADANAFKPGLGDTMAAMDPAMLTSYVVMDFVVGFLLVWTYAAVRPRFGPGPTTAVKVGLLFWVFGLILSMGYLQMGMMSSGLFWTYGLVWLVNLMLAVSVGGRIYTEDAATV
ncbi:MAG TPA: hypothetical protein VHM24_07300 [Gemmatimonadaceae bacterium]|nr:hypothetical protein [Gemmatimonadaceae bacterium]